MTDIIQTKAEIKNEIKLNVNQLLSGTLETYDNAALKCRRQQKKINEKTAKVRDLVYSCLLLYF